MSFDLVDLQVFDRAAPPPDAERRAGHHVGTHFWEHNTTHYKNITSWKWVLSSLYSTVQYSYSFPILYYTRSEELIWRPGEWATSASCGENAAGTRGRPTATEETTRAAYGKRLMRASLELFEDSANQLNTQWAECIESNVMERKGKKRDGEKKKFMDIVNCREEST